MTFDKEEAARRAAEDDRKWVDELGRNRRRGKPRLTAAELRARRAAEGTLRKKRRLCD